MKESARVVEARKVDLVFQTSDGPVHALSEIDLEINKGDFISLIGPSGCGKTTLLRIAAGLETIQSGQVEIGGELVADADRSLNLPPEKRGVGLMFQDYALFPHLTIQENISFGIAKKNRSAHQSLMRLS